MERRSFDVNSRQVISMLLGIEVREVNDELMNAMVICGHGYINEQTRADVFDCTDKVFKKLADS